MTLKTTAFSLALLLPSAGLAARTTASSELRDSDGDRHPAALAFDGLMQTGWAEADTGEGEGSWLELTLDAPTEISTISIWPGNLEQGLRSLKECGRPKSMTVTLSAPGQEDVSQTVHILDLAETGPQRVDVGFEEPIEARTVRVTIDEAFEGFVFNDTYISEVAINFTAGVSLRQVERLVEWQQSDRAKKAYEANKTHIIELFDKVNEAEFGNSDALAEIMDQAADGAPYLRKPVQTYVPSGYRVQALPPDDVAVSAVLKLKDANGIPALEMAALRLKGKDARQLADKVEMFYAYQDLIGGGSRNVPFWGQRGWEIGALRSFNEPMGIEVDVFGDLYVADLGNNRVQRFTSKGRSERIWGGEPDITNRWYAGSRRWYVAGSAPSEKPGEFVNPVDIEMIPGKDADGFAVLDSAGRVQVFDETGEVILGWELLTDDKIGAGVGGEGYIEYVDKRKGKIVVTWRDECFVYNMQSEELERWEIWDGRPNGMEVLPNGKLAMLFGPDMVMYSLDGFRHGSIIEDELGYGFEDWDITLDEDKKLWAVTDEGLAVKYKKPGKVDYIVDLSNHSFEKHRIAVLDDIVYVLERDRILKLDALEIKRQAELSEQLIEQGGEE